MTVNVTEALQDFIRNLMSNPIDEEIVISTIRVANRLKLRTVAEHVHSAAVRDRLAELGITFLQGDYFGKAVPIREFFGIDAKPVSDPTPAKTFAD